MEGLAILRRWGTDPSAVRERVREISTIAAAVDGDVYGQKAVIPQYDVAAGYEAWSGTYDGGPNILVEAEEQALYPLLETIPAGRALDAACGTGRHARWLAERGHQVVGIDASEAMLAVAREKAPGAEFRLASLESLDLPAQSVDLVVCALALTHLSSLTPAMSEFARVLAPAGRVIIISDVHPMKSALGLHAFFHTACGGRGCIRNLYHPISAYLDAFKEANLEVVRCLEMPWGEREITAQPVYPFIPDALDIALRGLPLLLIWDLSPR